MVVTLKPDFLPLRSEGTCEAVNGAQNFACRIAFFLVESSLVLLFNCIQKGKVPLSVWYVGLLDSACCC